MRLQPQITGLSAAFLLSIAWPSLVWSAEASGRAIRMLDEVIEQVRAEARSYSKAGAKLSNGAPSHTSSTGRGYELYFDGKRVSGPDAQFYTANQASENCAWNIKTKPPISIACFYNGVRMNVPPPTGSSGSNATSPRDNVALDKPSDATGSYGIYVASRGNDGDPNTIWNGGGHQACWSVDLQHLYSLSSIEVSSNQFGDSGLLTVFQIQISRDKSKWWLLGPPSTGRGSQTLSIPARGAMARFIGYCTLPGSTQWATLGELKASGTPAE